MMPHHTSYGSTVANIETEFFVPNTKHLDVKI